MSKDPLKKPVHVAILRPTNLQRLKKEGRLPEHWKFAAASLEEMKNPLPEPKHELVSYQRVAQRAGDVRKQTMLRTRLRVWHNKAPEIPEERKPPCDTCKTAACCHAFLVGITQDEYESGLYEEFAVKVDKEAAKQLVSSRFVRFATMHAPNIGINHLGGDQYYLEGVMGAPCPFLGEKNECTIYDKRPMTCRAYSCVGDPRITEGMRDGTVDIKDSMFSELHDALDALDDEE